MTDQQLEKLIGEIRILVTAVDEVCQQIHDYRIDCQRRDQQFHERVMPNFFRAGGQVYPVREKQES